MNFLTFISLTTLSSTHGLDLISSDCCSIMNGQVMTRYYWHTNMLREKSEEELHEFYKKLRNGDFYDPIPEIAEYKNVTLPRY